MSRFNLYVCHPSSLLKVKNFDCRWVFIDGDFNESQYFTQNSDPLFERNEFHNALAHLRVIYTKWVDENLEGLSQLDQVLSTLTRNPFDEFYRELMWMIFITDKIIHMNETIVIVTRSLRVAKVLEQFAFEYKASFKILGKLRYYSTLARNLFNTIAYFILEILFLTATITSSRIIFDEKYLRRIQNVKVFVDVFLFGADINSEGIYNQRYYPKLMNWFKHQGVCAAYMPVFYKVSILGIFKLLRKLKESEHLFIVTEFFLKFQDIFRIIKILSANFCYSNKLKKPYISNLNAQKMIRYSAYSSVAKGIKPVGILLASKHMAVKNLNPCLVMDWFENQPIDQAVMVGFTGSFPGCEVVAVRPYALYSKNLLSYQVTEREIRSGVVPRLHYVGGRAWLDYIDNFDSSGRYELIPSFRNTNLFESTFTSLFSSNLLVALPYSLSESQYILFMISEVIDTVFRCYERLIIKVHPAVHLSTLQKLFEDMVDISSFRMVIWNQNDDFVSLLSEAKAVVTGGSSAALEAAIFNVPIIFLPCPRGIDLCPKELVENHPSVTIYSVKNFRDSLVSFSKSNCVANAKNLTAKESILRNCYVDFSESTMAPFRQYLFKKTFFRGNE